MQTAVDEKKKKSGGYLTLEATFIVLFTSVLVMGILLLVLYFLDVGAAKSLMNQHVTELSLQKDSDKDKEATRILKTMKEQMLISDVKNFRLESSGLYLAAHADVVMKSPVPVIGAVIGPLWKNHITIKVERGMDLERIRRWEFFE